MQERTVQLAGNRFRCLERPGPGPVLLCLHGLGDSADQFGPIAALLPASWRLLAPDQRGHGGSWRPAEGYSPHDFAGDAAALLEEAGVASAHVVGHSMGGRNGLALAARHPGRVRSLVVGDIGPDDDPVDLRATRAFFRRLPDSFATEEEAREHWRGRKPGYGEASLDILMRNLEPAPDGGLRWRFSKEACIAAVTEARSRAWWELLPEVRCPVLLLHVEGSPELSEEVAERMRDELRDVRCVRVPDSGHNFQLENPGFAAEAIRRFVEEVEGQG